MTNEKDTPSEESIGTVNAPSITNLFDTATPGDVLPVVFHGHRIGEGRYREDGRVEIIIHDVETRKSLFKQEVLGLNISKAE